MEISDIIYFKIVYDLFDQYYRIETNNNMTFDDQELCAEAKKRIMQLEHLLNLVKIIDSKRAQQFKEVWESIKEFGEINGENTKIPIEVYKGNTKAQITNQLFLIELHAESFYYIAFRLRNIIRHLPNLGKKFESEGIRNVRNLIIEHPQTQKIYSNGFSCGNKEIGPCLKSIRLVGDNSYHDKGLYHNAEEFKNNLENMLNNYLCNNNGLLTDN
ncbi:MAG: hypothetical protein PHR83_07610 [Paludibacter sp.]|nr:hypothetical protein [Paludibacter sp.]